MTVFDEDSVNFASDVANTLLTAKGMIVAIANYKGVPVGDLSGMNELASEITIDPKVYYNYKSLKDLLSYAAEVCGVCLISGGIALICVSIGILDAEIFSKVFKLVHPLVNRYCCCIQ